MLISSEQVEKIATPISVTFLEMDIDVIDVCSKANHPICVTLSGISIDLML